MKGTGRVRAPWRALWRAPWRDRRPQRPANDLIDRFGETCPVCGAGLGEEIPIDAESGRFEITPTIRLQVGGSDDAGQPSWRVSFVQQNFRGAASSMPPFSERDVDYVYLLCGGGHIFPDASPIFYGYRRRAEGQQHIDVWNMVAAIGAPASGKTYLLLRALNQSLNNEANLDFNHQGGLIRPRELSPLENVPLLVRNRGYAGTLTKGEAISPTASDQRATPHGILQDELRDALSATQDLIRRTVVAGEQRARAWGRTIRQPLVMRTDVGAKRTWTGVADLPGEFFDDESGNARARAKLRAYDALVWVVDPVVTANVTRWFDAASLYSASAPDGRTLAETYGDVLDGSLRPGTSSDAVPSHLVRSNREQVQLDIGRHLSQVESTFGGGPGGAIGVLIAVTKCDLIRVALRNKGLEELSDPGVVRAGAAAFLRLIAGRHAKGAIGADRIGTDILEYVWAGQAADATVREQRAQEFAVGLLEHYSHPDTFWNLVHVGKADRIRIQATGREVVVPSVGDHMDASMQSSAGVILTRDLVMSVVGCGIAYGLGNESAIAGILRNDGQNPRFFLCSPLAAVPVATSGVGPDDPLMSPLDKGARFSGTHERSAALTQLLLAMLEKVRGVK